MATPPAQSGAGQEPQGGGRAHRAGGQPRGRAVPPEPIRSTARQLDSSRTDEVTCRTVEPSNRRAGCCRADHNCSHPHDYAGPDGDCTPGRCEHYGDRSLAEGADDAVLQLRPERPGADAGDGGHPRLSRNPHGAGVPCGLSDGQPQTWLKARGSRLKATTRKE